MAMQVTLGASMMCTMGTIASSLVVLPQNRTTAQNKPAANILDHKPFVNIPPFGMCRSMANPAVASATAAAQGVLTPMPCTPVTPSPWAPGSSTVQIANSPALNNSSKCVCSLGGSISITNPGCTTVEIP